MEEMTQKQYDQLADMFASPGWKYFIGSASELERALTQGAVDAAPDNDKWQFLRGQIAQLRSVIGYEMFITAAWAEKEKDDESDPV